MRFERLSSEAQEGLNKWASYQHDDDLLFDDNASSPEFWAWICFQLRVALDKPEWFPKGKSATIQVIEEWLYTQAQVEQEARLLEKGLVNLILELRDRVRAVGPVTMDRIVLLKYDLDQVERLLRAARLEWTGDGQMVTVREL